MTGKSTRYTFEFVELDSISMSFARWYSQSTMNQRQRPNWVCAEQSGGTTKKTAHNPTQLISGRLLPASTILIRFLARVLWPYVATPEGFIDLVIFLTELIDRSLVSLLHLLIVLPHFRVIFLGC